MRKSIHCFWCFALFLVIFMYYGCTKSTSSSGGTYTGWAVGQSFNGYATLLYTQNDGFSWIRQQIPNLAPAVNLNDISVLNSLDAWCVGGVVNGYGLILNTVDGGVNWSRVGSQLQIPNAELMAVHVFDQQTIWITGKSNRILYTTDKAVTWHNFKIDSLVPVNYTSFTASGSKNLWISGEPVNKSHHDSVAVIMHSSDGGVTWSQQWLPDSLQGVVHSIFALDDSTLYAAADGFILKSFNGGQSWFSTFSLLNKRLNAVYAEDINNVWAVGNNDALYHTKNAGLAWDTIKPQVTGNNLLGVTANGAAQKVWIVGSNANNVGKGIILYSNNDGVTWFIEDYPVDAGLNKVAFAPGQ